MAKFKPEFDYVSLLENYEDMTPNEMADYCKTVSRNYAGIMAPKEAENLILKTEKLKLYRLKLLADLQLKYGGK